MCFMYAQWFRNVLHLLLNVSLCIPMGSMCLMYGECVAFVFRLRVNVCPVCSMFPLCAHCSFQCVYYVFHVCPLCSNGCRRFSFNLPLVFLCVAMCLLAQLSWLLWVNQCMDLCTHSTPRQLMKFKHSAFIAKLLLVKWLIEVLV